jgi:hypothetical protein
MFDQFRKNVASGFDFLKEKATDIYQRKQPEVQNTFDFARKINSGEEDVPDRVFEANRVQDQENYLNRSKAKPTRNYTKVEDIVVPKWDEEFQNKSIFGNRPETVVEKAVKGLPDAWMDTIIGKNRSLEPDKVGGVAGFAYDMATEIIRAPFSVANFASGKMGQGLNNIQEALGGKRTLNEETNNWVKDSGKYLEAMNPELGAGYKSFFGLKDGEGLESEASVERSGKEWSELINMVLPDNLDIKDGSNTMVAVGVIGSLLDTIPGAGGAKTSVKNIVKNSKNVDEVVEALRFFTKSGSEEDLVKYATELFAKKGDDTFSILTDLKKQDLSDSSIEFVKDADGNIEEFLKERQLSSASEYLDRVNKVDEGGEQVAKQKAPTVEEFLTNQDVQKLDDSRALGEGKVDEISENIARKENGEEALDRIFDEISKIDDADLSDEIKGLKKELDSDFNSYKFDDLGPQGEVDILKKIKENLDKLKYSKFKTGNLTDFFKRVEYGLIDDVIDVSEDFGRIAQDTAGTMANNMNTANEAFNAGRTMDFIDNVFKNETIGSALGGLLRSVKEIKYGSDANPVIKRYSEAVSEMIKGGMQKEDIAKAFDNYFTKNNIKASEATVKDIDAVFSESGTYTQKIRDFIQQYRYSNMLSNVSTQLINAVSNTFENTLSRPVSEAIASGLEALGIRGTGRKGSDFEAYLKGALNEDTLKNAFKKAQNVFKEVEDFKNQDISRVRRDFKVNAGTKADGTARDINISKIYRAPLRALEAGDSFFFEVVQQGELAKLVKQNGGKLTASIAKKARKTAEDAIFRMTDIDDSDGLVGRFFKKSAEGINQLDRTSGGILKFFVPFVNTLAILGKKGVRRTPILGLLELFKTSKGKTGSLVVQDIAGVMADQALGTGVALGGYKFAQYNADKYKLERKDGSSKEVRYADAEGNNYMSIKVGDRWIDLDSMGPIALPFVMGMKWYDMEKNMDKEGINKMMEFFQTGQILEAVKNSGPAMEFLTEWMGTAVKESTNNEFAGSFYDTLQVMSGSYQGNPATFFGQTLRQFSPYSSFLGAVNKTGVDKRKTISPENLSEMVEYAFKDFIDIPGSIKDGGLKFYSEGMEQKTDPDGIPLFYGDKDAGLGRRALDAINPTRPQVRNEDIADKRKFEEEKNKLRGDIKELDGDFTKQEERAIVNAIDKAQTTGNVTQKEMDMLKALSPEQAENFMKDWFKEENSELLLIYKKAKDTGNIKQSDLNKLKSASPDLLKKIAESYQDDKEAIDLLVVEKALKTGNIKQSDLERMKQLDPRYLKYLEQKIYEKEARARKSFNKTNAIY